jgi:(S)-2-hydroxy-acid oxidase
MAKVVCVKDLEERSKSASRSVYEFWNSGANELITLRENEECFDNYRIRGRGLVDVSKVDLRSKPLFGKRYDMPVGIAPCAHHQLATTDGEVATIRACEKSGWPLALSSFSSKSAADVKAAGPNSAVFFQLYVFQNRQTTEELIKRVEKAGYKAILLTIDTPYVGQRYADMHNKFQLPDHLKMGNFEGLNVANPTERSGRTSAPTNNVIDPSLNWVETIPWLRARTNLEVWVKGVVTAEDTELALQAGVDGIWVSNHGGRQLDSAVPSIEALPEVVAAAKGRIPIHVDGGIRRGGDIFKALALGADFVWVARPALWGLLYDGQAGVELMQKLLFDEFKLVMALAGTLSIEQINENSLLRIWPRPQRVPKL